ncbi:MAG: AzlD domain-containing protein [Eubacteriales bacterium]|nr:AzlD domain-containing protein [Eubacteriales bacterium]
MSNTLYAFSAIAVCSIITILIRALPFVIFGNKELPSTVTYLGKVLPGAIMIILVIFCLRNISFSSFPFGLPEFICIGICALLQHKYKNSILSVIISTILYMIIIRII